MSKRARYTVVTENSRLGRWVSSLATAKRIADLWADAANGSIPVVKVLDETGAVAYSVAS